MMPLLETGLFRGSTKYFRLDLFDKNGNRIAINPANLFLDLYMPNGSVITYNSGFEVQSDGGVIRAVSIDDLAPKGVWKAVWRYTDNFGNTWREEVAFIVSDPKEG